MRENQIETILITGSSGAIGMELQDCLISTQHIIIPTTRRDNSKYYLDVTNYNLVYSFLKDTRPDLIFHLAAIVPIPIVEKDQTSAFITNVMGLNNVLKAVEELAITPRIVVTSSSEVYGNGQKGRKFVETDPYSPNNFYAYTKVAQEELSQLYLRRGLDIKVGRIFNYSSIYKKPIYSLESFTNQIATVIIEGKDRKIIVGNLEPERDFLQGKDVAKALIRIAFEETEFQTFNISRGETISMQNLLQLIIKEFGIDVEIMKDDWKYRKIDNFYVCGDNERIKSIGWCPEISINGTVHILVQHYKKMFKI